MYIDAYKNEMTHDNKTNKNNNLTECFKCGHEQTTNEDFNFCTKCLTHL